MRLSFRQRHLKCFDARIVSSEAEGLLPPDTEVEAIDVAHNAIQAFLGGDTVQPLELNMHSNNMRSLEGLPSSLRKLTISKNALQTVNGVRSLHNLVFLNVSQNGLARIPEDVLPATLQTVLANHNGLDTVRAFLHLRQLQRLELEHNRLAKVSDVVALSVLRSLRHLSLRANPLCKAPQLVALLTQGIERLTTLNGESLSQAKTRPVAQAVRAAEVMPHAATSARDPTQPPPELVRLKIRVNALEQQLSDVASEEGRVKRSHGLLRAQVQQCEELEKRQRVEAQALQKAEDELRRQVKSLRVTLTSTQEHYADARRALYAKRLGDTSCDL